MPITHLLRPMLVATALLPLAGCALPPEIQAKMDEFNRTIPTCDSDRECQVMWTAARNWARENSDFAIYSESETRIRATSTLTTSSGMGIVVRREPQAGGYRILVEVECFTVYGCPEEWDAKLDFNRVVAAAGS